MMALLIAKLCSKAPAFTLRWRKRRGLGSGACFGSHFAL